MLLYDSKFMKFPRKFKTHWKGPYVVQKVTDGGAVQLAKLNGEIFPSMINGSRLKSTLTSQVFRTGERSN